MRTDNYYSILSITRHQSRIFNRRNITVTIYEVYFYNNGYLQNNTGNPNSMLLSPLHVHIDISNLTSISLPKCNVALKKTTFKSNRNTFFINIAIVNFIDVQLIEVTVVNNTIFGKNINLFSWSVIVLLIKSSNFVDNYGYDVSS